MTNIKLSLVIIRNLGTELCFRNLGSGSQVSLNCLPSVRVTHISLLHTSLPEVPRASCLLSLCGDAAAISCLLPTWA